MTPKRPDHANDSRSGRFECGLSVIGSSVVLTPDGELDIDSVDEFGRQAMKALDMSDLRIVVDLSRMTFLDSTGLNTLARLHASAREHGREILFSQPRLTVRRILGVVGLDELFGLSEPRTTSTCPICDGDIPRGAAMCGSCRSRLR